MTDPATIGGACTPSGPDPVALPADQAAERPGWGWVWFPVTVFLVHRALAVAVSYVSLAINPRLYIPHDGPTYPLFQGLSRWDSAWFARISVEGYAHPHSPNFFPMFPLLGRAVGAATGLEPVASLLLVANLAGLLALVIVYRIFTDLAGRPAARAGLVLWAAWPFSFFHAAAYPESLMNASSAAAIILAARGRHVAAGAALGVGMLSRHLTAMAWLSVLAAGVRQHGWNVRRLALGPVGAGFLVAAAMVWAYFGFLWATFGDPFVWAKLRSEWGQMAWWSVLAPLTVPATRHPIYASYIVGSVVTGAGAFLLLRDARWRVLAPFAIGLMLLLWATGLAGLGRYSASCWPAFLPIGAWLASRRGLRWAWVIGSAASQGVVLYYFAHGYAII